MRAFYLAASLMVAIPLPVLSQEAARPLREVIGIPTDLYRASNLVTNPAWMSGTVLRDVVVIAFKEGVTAGQRSRLYELVGARAVYLDPDDGPPPLFYLAIINDDPRCLHRPAGDNRSGGAARGEECLPGDRVQL
jgi:hypothetical protein